MNRILVALDNNTETADLVLERAIELAERTGGKLQLFHVVAETADPPVANIFSPGGDVNALIAASEAELLRCETRIPEKHRDGVVVVVGQAHEAICKQAKSYNADIVFIGAHRYGLLDRMLGTTVAKVVNHIDRPVFIVRPIAPVVAPSSKKGKQNSVRPKANANVVAAAAGNAGSSDHALFGAATLAGATTGAVVGGAVAGPPGVVAGGLVGTAIGMIAGVGLDRADHRQSFHDHELDDAIGVTSGDLGARERASAVLTGLQHEEAEAARANEAVAVPNRFTTLATMLREEHERLERVYDGLLGAYRRGQWEDVRTEWAKFEPALQAHMTFEEQKIFPAFRMTAPACADTLVAEHAHMRKLLDTLAIAIEIHAMPQGDAEELVMRLRAHGHREEQLLYPWLDTEPRQVAVDALGKLAANRMKHVSAA